MGNSPSTLERYRYHFDDPKIGDLDLSYVTVYKIDDEVSAVEAKKFLSNAPILYVDCEGHYFGSPEQKLGTVQVATNLSCCLVFHITKYRKSLDFLKVLFESNDVQKVFHDCSGDSSVLFHANRIRLTSRSVDDTQIAHKVIEALESGKSIDRTTGRSLADLYEHYCGKRIPGNKRRKKHASPGPRNCWTELDLSPAMIKYAVVDALATCEIFTKQKKMLRRSKEYLELIQKQIQRKRRGPESKEEFAPLQASTSSSSNWGLFAVGVGAMLAVGAAAAAANADRTQKDRRLNDEEQQKKDECIIS